MIVRKNLKWSIILRSSWPLLLAAALLSLTVYILYFHCGIKGVGIPFSPIAVMGTALSIFLGFRNSSSYDRWWEARKIWGGIVNQSRTLTRQVITLPTQTNIDLSAMKNIQRELVYRHLAWINALRLQLRGQGEKETWDREVYQLIGDAETVQIEKSINKTTQLLLMQGIQLAELAKAGIFDNFRYIQIDDTLTELCNLQGQCERIKSTPLPRQYDFFNKIFTYLFLLLLPFGMVEIFDKSALPILIVPFNVIICFVFYVIEGVGRRLENPFENRITDIPLSALCRTIEIDLRQMLGENDIPSKLEPVDGFLF